MPLDPCPYCGKQFDHQNAGARENHVEACRADAEKFQQTAPNGGAQPQRQPQAPARPQPRQGGLPAAAGEGDILEVATEAGRQLAALQNASPEEKAQVEGRLGKAAARLVEGFFDQRTEERVAGIKRSEDYDGQPEVVKRYTTCESCGRQLEYIPEPGTEFDCKWCGTRLRA